MHILIVEPFYIGSHKQWIDGLIKNSNYQFTLLTLPGRHWKWRMQGGAVELAKRYNALKQNFDLIVASDMLNLCTFKALTQIVDTPVALYFHENQLTYPWSKTDTDPITKRDAAYQFINYTAALCADTILFNSNYHLQSFIEALPLFLKQFPDHQGIETIEQIEQKSHVLHLGLDLKKFDELQALQQQRNELNEYPLILWNHRWEYDKNPELFFNTLIQLKEKGVKFRLVVLGKSYARQPEIFKKVPQILEEELLHFGYCKDETSYINWLQLADILPVTSIQDFFGISVMEAVYCNTIPLLPKRLAYPEHFPKNLHHSFFYTREKDLSNRLQRMIFNIKVLRKQKVQQYVAHYDWTKQINIYQQMFKKMTQG